MTYATPQQETRDTERDQQLSAQDRQDRTKAPISLKLQDLPDEHDAVDVEDTAPPSVAAPAEEESVADDDDDSGEASVDDDDCFSTVSSLSNDDSLSFNALNMSSPLQDEVAIPECSPMKVSFSRFKSRPPTDVSLPRSSLVRCSSAPALQSLGSYDSYESMPVDAIVVNGKKVVGVTRRDRDPFASKTHKSPLLAHRPRRITSQSRTKSASSVGGMCSVVTAPSTVAGTINTSCSISPSQVSRKTPVTVVKEEVKYVLGVMSSPVRPLVKAMQKTDTLKLNRSKGYLV